MFEDALSFDEAKEIYEFSVRVVDTLAATVADRLLACDNDSGAQAGIMRVVGLKAFLGDWTSANNIVAHVKEHCRNCDHKEQCFASVFLDQLRFEIKVLRIDVWRPLSGQSASLFAAVG